MNEVRRTNFDPARQVTFRPCPDGFEPPFSAVTSVAVAPFLSPEDLVCVRLERGVDLPGGHVDVGESSVADVAKREAWEEARIELGRLALAATIESDYYGTEPYNLTYMVSVAALVTRMTPFVPSDESTERLVLRPVEFLRQYRWDRTTMRLVLERSLEKLFGEK